MKTLIRNLVALGISVVALGSISVYAATNPVVVQQAQNIITAAVDNVVSAPSPTPIPTVVPTLAPTIAPVPVPTSIPSPTDEPFPVVQPTATTVVNQGLPQATTQPVPVPQTAVFISVRCPVDQNCSDPDTGGVKCIAPCAITFQANFQGGFPGTAPTFKWSDGGTDNPHVITYTAAGSPHISVTAYEDYQGHTYTVGSANSIPITIQ